MFGNGKKTVAALTACIHLLTCGLPLSLYGQDSSGTPMSIPVYDGEIPAQQTAGDTETTPLTGIGETVHDDTAREYYDATSAVVPAVRRGLTSASSLVKAERKMLVDTAGIGTKREQQLQDSLYEEQRRAALQDSLQREKTAPALRLGKRGKVIALISSVTVVGAAAVYVWFAFVKGADDAGVDRIPDPPSLPGI